MFPLLREVEGVLTKSYLSIARRGEKLADGGNRPVVVAVVVVVVAVVVVAEKEAEEEESIFEPKVRELYNV